MADELPAADLQKASENLGRLHAFLAARTSWAVGAGGDALVPEILGAIGELSSLMGGMLQESGISFPRRDVIAVDQLPEGELDADRLRQVSSFLLQMKRWFVHRCDWRIGGAGREPARQVQAFLIGLSASLRTIAAHTPAPAEPGTPAGSPGPAVPSEPPKAGQPHKFASGPAPTAAAGGTEAAPAERSNGARLELEDRVEAPLLVMFRGASELSSVARELIDGFLGANGIELGATDLRRFYVKVLKWIENTPEGQMLVLKIGWRDGIPAPYSSYVPRAREAPGD